MVGISFRAIDATTAPMAGELLLQAPEDHPEFERRLSMYVVEQGLKGLKRGPVVPSTLVVRLDPTLDDLLAASFVSLLLRNESLPRGLEPLARYAALCREGLRPTSLEAEQTIEGVFLAMRSFAGEELGDKGKARAFLDSWKRLESALLKGAERGADPFQVSYVDAPDFSRERAFLREDRLLYESDKLRGESWAIRFPDDPAPSSGLLLRVPKSLLFKYWARRDEGAPSGKGFVFLAVKTADGKWIFSTDPVHRISLKGLAEELDRKENPGGRAWFDGAPFAHSLVASPQSGTKLDEGEVLKVVTQWLHARRVRSAHRRLPVRAAVLLGLVLCAAVAITFLRPHSDPSEPRPLERGSEFSDDAKKKLRTEGTRIPGFAIIIGVGEAQSRPEDRLTKLEAAVPDASRFYLLLRDRYGFDPENIMLLVDQPKGAKDPRGFPLKVDGVPTYGNLISSIRALGAKTRQYAKGSRTNFVFYFSGHGQQMNLAESLGYLCLSGYDSKRADETGFNMSFLSKFISQHVESTHRMILADCCFSGYIIKARGRRLENPSAIYSTWKEQSKVIITAGTEEQPTYEVRGQSFFSTALHEGLGPALIADQEPKDGIVTDAELGAYLDRRVPEIAKRYGCSMNPLLMRDEGAALGQYLFIPKDHSVHEEK